MAANRYKQMFARLSARAQGAFIPFMTLGDPDLSMSLELIEAMIHAGADALELGLPFSDPIADGPVIQAAGQRALTAGVKIEDCWALARTLRQRHPELPMGLLVYANLVYHRGVERFYAVAAEAGIDSVLVADVPTEELEPFSRAARAVGICPVLIATPSADDERLGVIASQSQGYTYVVTRRGVTGADEVLGAGDDHKAALIAKLQALGAPPPILGFGISKPEHVREALRAGAAGAISGSAIVSKVPSLMHDPPALKVELAAFVAQMKAATG